MKLIIGLGNPGMKYCRNRHNVGHMIIDELKKLKNKNSNYVFLKTDTFMNESGMSVKKYISKYSVSNSSLYIIHDDLDIDLGEYKIQFGKGPKEHNGLLSIDNALETNEYWHVRVGINNRKSFEDDLPSGKDYVLSDFTNQELDVLGDTIVKICNQLVS